MMSTEDDHRPLEHEKICKKKMAELRDNDLFAQPDSSHLGECPICCLPMSLDPKKSGYMGCCSKSICLGCNFSNTKREMDAGLEPRCAFCREPTPESDEEAEKKTMERIKKNDPEAMNDMGKKHYHEGNYETAFEYFTNAAGLGDAKAHFLLSCMYRDGKGVEKDMKKQVYHSEEAAIGGHHMARHNLGCIEADNGRFERARKHWIIAAKLGYHRSLSNLKILYADGRASKEDYADALRAYQAAVDATKSEDREVAEFYVSKAREEGER